MNVYELQVKKEGFKNGKSIVISKTIQVRIPTTPSEMTMKQWSNFHLTLKEAPDWFKSIEFEDEQGMLEQVKVWNEENWMDFYLSVGSLLASVSPDEVTINDLLSVPFTSAKQGDGLLAMYSVLIDCIQSYQPTERRSFEWQGATYVVPKSITDSFGATMVGANLTTIESIEALQFSQVLNGKDEHGEPVFEDAKYQTDLALMACLCRKVKKSGELESMPLDFVKRRRFIDQRMQKFKDVPFNIALDIDFFLSGLFSASLRTRTYHTLSTLLSTVSRMPSD